MNGTNRLIQAVKNDFHEGTLVTSSVGAPVLAAPGILATAAAFGVAFGKGAAVSAAAWGAAAAGAAIGAAANG